MTSLNRSLVPKESPPELTISNDNLAAQQRTANASESFEQISAPNLLKPATPSRSLQSSSVSSTPKGQVGDDDDGDKIQQILSNGFHDSPPSPLRRRRTRGATISEHTEAWDKSYVLSFGMYMLRLY